MFDKDFLGSLRDPPRSYRPIPFWSWNEKLRTDETRRQIMEMDRVGIGGYFMHARSGLQTIDATIPAAQTRAIVSRAGSNIVRGAAR